MSVPNEVRQKIGLLVSKYQKDSETDRLRRYSEEQTKSDFIDPLFAALGWDISNASHQDEVTREEKVSRGRVDYCFRINGIPKFYLEAKSFKEGVSESKYIEQAITYAWNKGCAWAVLTDFEEVRIFNAEWLTSDHMQNHLKTVRCTEFISRFEELWLLSKDSFEKGLLDIEARKWGKKTTKNPVDKQLLQDFTFFREILSKDIARLNQSKRVTQEELDEAVQRILDRLIFIRNCEDRELEPRQLISNLREWESRGKGQLISGLREVFTYFDKHYNSKIFSPHLCDELVVDNDVLTKIVEGLYFTQDRTASYDFSAIEADVLGNIYEQYLGYILKKTEKRATLTQNQSHRKEQGIYYTPTYIVDYIVRNALSGVFSKETTRDPNSIRIVDPACGSGSFLIKAFDVLNDYHVKHEKNYEQTQLDFTGGATYSAKLRVLTKNIFGVDLDKQAVEIAQLNLLLKIAEKGQRLPLLQQNIKIGNSLIEQSVSTEDRPFQWKAEFPSILDKGGFDVVIGNPPYVNMQTMPELQAYCQTNYPEIYTGQNDILYYFVLRGLQLLREGGRLGFVVSRYFLESSYASKFRKFIGENSEVETIIDFNNYQVFGREVNVLTCIIILRKSSSDQKKKKAHIIKIKRWDGSGLELMRHITQHQLDDSYSDENLEVFTVTQKKFSESAWTFSNEAVEDLKLKVRRDSVLLGDLFEIGKGMETGLNEAFVIEENEVESEKIEPEVLRNYIKTRDLKPFVPLARRLKIIYIPEKTNESRIKHTLRHLEKWMPELKARFDYKKGHCEWYSWGNLRNRELFESAQAKIITPLYSTSNKFVLDRATSQENFYTLTDTYILVPKADHRIDLRYVVALLNSKLIEFYFKSNSKLKREGYYEYSGGSLSKIPLRLGSKHEARIVGLTDELISKKKELNKIGSKKTDERGRLEGEIEETSYSIDELVFETYSFAKTDQETVEQYLSQWKG